MKAKKLKQNSPPRRLIKRCLAGEEVRSLSTRSTDEIAQRFDEFADFRDTRKIVHIQDLTQALFENFVHTFDHRNSVALNKAVVWAMRKLGAWLALHPEPPYICCLSVWAPPVFLSCVARFGFFAFGGGVFCLSQCPSTIVFASEWRMRGGAFGCT